jgi:hypothetical protein
MKIMERFGLGNQWIYRDEVTKQSYGMDDKLFLAKCSSADFFVNISCSTVMRDEYRTIPNRILIDSDPMFTQIQINSEESFNEKDNSLKDLAAEHNHHFTFGENINSEKCRIPDTGFNFKPTRQPVSLDYWPFEPLKPESALTTLMNWSAGKRLIFEGESWGQKDIEFNKIKNIPPHFLNEKFDIVVNKTGGELSDEEKKIFSDHNWNLIDSSMASADERLYQQFILNSKAELSVAKHTYVKANTGWFSCRSACYLASGRPVIAQDTGWSRYYTTGVGLFAFSNQEEAMQAIELVNADLKSQSEAARQIAEAYFDSNKVLSNLLDAVEAPVTT